MRFVYLFLVVTSLFFASTAIGATAIKVENVRAKSSFPMAQTGAVYFTLRNPTETSRTLTGISVDEAVAADAQLHTTELKNEMMRMREVTEGLTIPAESAKSLKPGGYHVMLLGLTRALTDGESFPLTLHFDNKESVTVTVSVMSMDTDDKPHQHHQHQGH